MLLFFRSVACVYALTLVLIFLPSSDQWERDVNPLGFHRVIHFKQGLLFFFFLRQM